MAAVSVPRNDPWVVARWAFRLLLERTAPGLGNEDRPLLDQAIALDGLHFDLLEPPQAVRVAQAMRYAADALRIELLEGDLSDPRDAELADALVTLEMILHDVHE